MKSDTEFEYKYEYFFLYRVGLNDEPHMTFTGLVLGGFIEHSQEYIALVKRLYIA